MAKEVHHSVRRPGRRPGDPDVEIPVAADLATVPGIPLREHDVSFYSREYPLESQTIDKGADREWVWTVYTEEIEDYRKGHDERVEPLVEEATVSGDLAPTGTPEPGRDVTGTSGPARANWDSARWASRGWTGGTSTAARSAGPSTSTPYAWPMSRTTSRLR